MLGFPMPRHHQCLARGQQVLKGYVFNNLLLNATENLVHDASKPWHLGSLVTSLSLRQHLVGVEGVGFCYTGLLGCHSSVSTQLTSSHAAQCQARLHCHCHLCARPGLLPVALSLPSAKIHPTSCFGGNDSLYRRTTLSLLLFEAGRRSWWEWRRGEAMQSVQARKHRPLCPVLWEQLEN